MLFSKIDGVAVDVETFAKHSLNIAFKLPSDKGKNIGILETFAKISLQATLKQRKKQWLP